MPMPLANQTLPRKGAQRHGRTNCSGGRTIGAQRHGRTDGGKSTAADTLKHYITCFFG